MRTVNTLNKSPPARCAVGLAVAALIGACGGGGDAALPTPPTLAPTQLKGVAAIGAPLAGASIGVIDSDTATADPAPVIAGADGSFTVDVTGLRPPLMVVATLTTDGVTTRTVAVVPTVTANADNTANVTPLTNAVAVLVAPGGNLDALLVPAALAAGALAQDVSNATALLVNTLTTDPQIGAELGSNFNPLTTPFVANGSGVDGVLDKLTVEASASGVSITNLTAPVAEGAVAQAAVLTASQVATPTVVPTLPASTPASELPTAAEIAALGAKSQACLALPVSQRVTLDAQGVVTALSATCDFAAADFKHQGRTWMQDIGQYTYAKDLMTGAKFGKGLIVFNAAPPNLSDPKEFKHPYCNTATCVIVRYPVTTASGYAHSSDALLAKVSGEWNFVGNQTPYRTFVDPRLVRKIATSRAGAGASLGAGESYYYKDRFESSLRLVFDLTSPNTNSVRAVRFSGPGLPSAGVVLFRSQRCGSDDIMGIAYQNGSTRVNTSPTSFQFWTGSASAEYFLDAANLDGTPLTMPTPVLDTTTAVAQTYSPAPIENQATAIPAWSRYKIEIFRFDTLSDSPDEILYTRIQSAAENATKGYGKPWPTLSQSFIDNYLVPSGASAGALSSLSQTVNWASLPNTFVWSGWLFGQNFATLTNAESETASYGVRSRLDFEPAVLGNTSATGIAFANPRSGVSMSSYTASTTTNPNPRCTSTDVVPLTTNTSDYREVGLSFRGADRKLYNSIWFWDN